MCSSQSRKGYAGKDLPLNAFFVFKGECEAERAQQAGKGFPGGFNRKDERAPFRAQAKAKKDAHQNGYPRYRYQPKKAKRPINAAGKRNSKRLTAVCVRVCACVCVCT